MSQTETFPVDKEQTGTLIHRARAEAGMIEAPVLHCQEGLSFWGGVDPQTGVILDTHHPQYGECVAGKFLLMPSSRGSCTGSAVLLGLALAGHAPAALVFREAEDVLTLGAIIANNMFEANIAVSRLNPEAYRALSNESEAVLRDDTLYATDMALALTPLDQSRLALSPGDQHMLTGEDGPAARLAMETLVTMAALQGAETLIDVSRAHIDGCIYASPANLSFAQAMQEMGASVRVPTSMNAISVDLPNWRAQGIAPDFGQPASQLAKAYLAMGTQPSFTCAPYLLHEQPGAGENLGWAESNAVIYANSILGARTNKHPDFLDLMIAITGRAPAAGVYLEENRAPNLIIDVDLPGNADDAAWPLLGWLVGRLAPDRIPLLTGLASHAPSPDDLKALCAAFGTTSGAPMLHIQGLTPEAMGEIQPDLPRLSISRSDLAEAWQALNQGAGEIDLIALGSPHFSAPECRQFADLMGERCVAAGVKVMITAGRAVRHEIAEDGTLARLEALGVELVSDVCWCSISKPLFPISARNVLTNSGKYAHYGPSLTGCTMRLASLAECARAAQSGQASTALPDWLR